MKCVKKHIVFCLLLFTVSSGFAEKKTFLRDYTYKASKWDTKESSRTIATTEMRNILLREIGTFIQSEQQITVQGNKQDYAEKTEAITAGIVEMKPLDEQWDDTTKIYYIKAEMVVDPDDVNQRIAEVLNDKQKTKQLEESRKRTGEAEAEITKLKSEMEALQKQFAMETDAMKRALAEEKSKTLQASYITQVDKLSAEEYIMRGYNASENGQYDLAIENYQKAISVDPNTVAAYNNLGYVFVEQEKYPEAIENFQKAIRLDPNDAFGYTNIGNAYVRHGKYPEAIENLQKAIRLDPNDAFGYSSLGNFYETQKKYPEAIENLQKAIRLDPNAVFGYRGLGNVYYSMEKYPEAIENFQKAIRADSNDARTYNLLGNVSHRQSIYR